MSLLWSVHVASLMVGSLPLLKYALIASLVSSLMPVIGSVTTSSACTGAVISIGFAEL